MTFLAPNAVAHNAVEMPEFFRTFLDERESDRSRFEALNAAFSWNFPNLWCWMGDMMRLIGVKNVVSNFG
jgi:hypothetical protein